MTEKLVAMSPPSSKLSAGPAEDTSADRPYPGGLLARRPVDAGEGSLEEQELELVRQSGPRVGDGADRSGRTAEVGDQTGHQNRVRGGGAPRTSATTSTPWRAATGATPAMASGPRRC